MPDHTLLWGDFHSHFVDLDGGDAVLADARENIDFCAVLAYPFVWDEKSGLRVESVRNRPEFLTWWERLRTLTRDHHDPGRFVTFLGYEWNGNRTRFGDHNVIYFDEDNPLDDAWSLPDLYAHLRTTRALAIPHHTGYHPTHRGKDWSVVDPDLSPVMELFSIHGSSEGCGTPLGMTSNTSMGPRTAGGTFHDALRRGLRIGVIGSNDYVGLQGRWGIGRAAVWAEACTREGIWEAILARRTYAVTGDRIRLAVHINGQPMGSVLQAPGPIDVEVDVVGSDAIDRIELLHNACVVAAYTHAPHWQRPAPIPTGSAPPSAGSSGDVLDSNPTHYKLRITCGWGPCTTYGLHPTDNSWSCRLDLEGGRLAGIERCFSRFGQRITHQTEAGCSWELVSAGRVVRDPFGMTQAVIAEIEGTPATRIHLDIDGTPIHLTLGELLTGGRLVPLLDESRRIVLDTFGIDEDAIGNPDDYFHNARKIKIHRAVPEAAWRVAHTFRAIPLLPGPNALYVRISQTNGQYAWSSPIWVEAPS